MKKQTLIYALGYGLCGGLLILVLKLVEYRFLVLHHSVEIYGGLIALLFAGLGIWLGLKLTRKKEVIVVREIPVAAVAEFAVSHRNADEFGITPREPEF